MFVVEGEVGMICSDVVKLMMMVSMIEESWPFDLCPLRRTKKIRQ